MADTRLPLSFVSICYLRTVFLSYNSYITKFTLLKCTIHWFFKKYIHRVVHPSSLFNSRTSSLPQKETPYSLAVIPHFTSQPLPTNKCTFCLYKFAILDISYKRNYALCGLLCLASLTSVMFTAHSCCSMDQYFIPFIAKTHSLYG